MKRWSVITLTTIFFLLSLTPAQAVFVGDLTGSLTVNGWTGGGVYIAVADGPDITTANIFVLVSYDPVDPPTLPPTYSVDQIGGTAGQDVWVLGFWDANGSVTNPPNDAVPDTGDPVGMVGPVQLAAGMTGVDLVIGTVPQGSMANIAGTLSDGNGPVGDVWVQAFDGPCGGSYLGQARSDADGNYMITDLPPGDVFLSICAGCSHANYLNTWYGLQPWDESCWKAAPVSVLAGQNLSGIDFSLVEGPKLLSFLDLAVYNGDLQPGFQLTPTAAEFIETAVLSFPNPARSDYTFDLVADKLNWDAECRKLDDYWYVNSGAVDPADYGLYTLTLTLKGGFQTTYNGTLAERTIVGANDDASLTVAVNGDGSLDVGWTPNGTPDPDQSWQIRVREFDGGIPGREVYRGGKFSSDTTSAHINPGDLGCVETGRDYRVRVRSWSFDDQRAETVEKAFTYNPVTLVDRYAWFNVQKTGANLAVGFDVRPASRANLTSASVQWPGAIYTYNFSLVDNWYDISTKTRANRGWWVDNPVFPITDGTYTLTINYSDGRTDTVTKDFADIAVSGIDAGSMAAYVHPDGAVDFSWDLPPASNQEYQVRVRSDDGSLEYVKSGTLTDTNQMTLWPYELRGLIPGRNYSWRVRVFDGNFGVRERAISSFFYDPHKIGGPDVLYWFDVAVYNGTLEPGFAVIPGFRDKLREAYITGPNPNRPEYQFDLASDRLLWDTECRFLDAWTHDFGAVQPEDYGEYTLVLVFDTDPPGSPENFRLRIYSFNLHEATVIPANEASIGVTVYADGSVQVDWAPEAATVPGQKWQVRIREADTNKEVYRSPNQTEGTTSFTIPVENLGCVALGGNYKWLVRAYDPDSVRAETRFVEAIYNPTAFNDDNRVTSLYIADHRGILLGWFDVRPADRDRMLYANITGPNGVNYTYDLVNDWDDMTTETRVNRGWGYIGTGADITDDGVYTLTVRIDENNNGTYEAGTDTEVVINETLTQSPLTNIDSSTMAHMINPDGSMNFSWALPDGVTGQNYQLRIRNADHSLEYIKTGSLTDNNNAFLSFWDLRALVHGEQYIWLVRVFDDDFDTMVQSATKTFLYDPFYLYTEPVPADPQEGIDAGLQWLRDTQNADGSWGDPGSDMEANILGATEFAVMAFLNNGYSQNPGDGNYDAALENGLNYILARVIPVDPNDAQWMDGAISAVDGMAMNYTTAIGVLALVAADRVNAVPQYTAQISNAVLKITQMQNNEDNITGGGYDTSAPAYGGWGYGDPWPDPNGHYWGDMSNSQWDILALYEARDLVNPATIDSASIDLALSRAITFLEHCQNRPASNPLAWAHDNTRQDYNDGGLLYTPDALTWNSPTDSWSQAISTYAGIWGYISTGVHLGDGRIDDAINWAKTDNNFVGWYSWFNRPFYAYYTAAKALTMIGDAANSVNPNWYADLSQQLLFVQEPDGRWANKSQNGEGGDALTTSYALLTLATGNDSVTATLDLTLTGNATLSVTKPDQTVVDGSPINFAQGEVPSGTYIIDVTGTADGTYTLNVYGEDGVQNESIDITDEPIGNGEIHRYELVVTYITGYKVELVSGPISTNPHITIQEPTVARTADDVFRITWIDGDIDSNATVQLFYDTDNSAGGEMMITTPPGVFEDGPNYYDWDVSGLTPGSVFYLVGEINDSVSIVTDYSEGTVTISPDGMPRAWEEANGLDVYRNDSGEDIDGDGLTNLEEYNNATNPRNPDSDGDGLPDGWEVANGLNPNLDDADLDPDGDGFSNIKEFQGDTDPQDIDDVPAILGLYDDFNNDLIDASKWVHRERVRHLANNALVSKIRTDSNWDRNRQKLGNWVAVNNSLRTDVKILEYDRETTSNSVFARIEGSFYSTQAAPVDQVGDVWAGVFIGDRGNGGLEAWWGVSEQTAPDVWTLRDSGTLATVGGIAVNTVYSLELRYMGGGFEFEIFDSTGTSIQSGSSQGVNNAGAPFDPTKALSTGAGMVGDDPGLVYISAEFDNVYVDGVLSDDFNDGQWGSVWYIQEVVREIVDNPINPGSGERVLRLMASSEHGVSKTDTKAVATTFSPVIAADVTVPQNDGWVNPGSVEGAHGRARIAGYFYNDTFGPGSGQDHNMYQGDLFARIYLDRRPDGSLSAKSFVGRSDAPDQTVWTTLDSYTFAMPAFTNRAYKLSIQYKPDALIFRCKDTVTGQSEKHVYNIVTSTYPAFGEFIGLNTRFVNNSNGDADGEMVAYFDNVYIEKPALDSDGDGVIDEQDAFPFDPNETVDSDNDGVGDNADVFPADPTEWADTDGDNTGNNADPDDDNDNMPDAYELTHGLNPLVDDAAGDRDEDGVSNIDEMNAGTDPSVPDLPPLVIPGDVNGDTQLTMADVLLAFQVAAGLPVDPAGVNRDADVNADGRIGVAEALYVLQFLADVRTAGAVSTTRDDRGIWYIAGPESATLYSINAAMGYAVATDRLWQAETYRRAARGTLAEVFGASFRDQDVLMRITGYTEAELTAGYDSLDAEAREMIDGYVAGFNRRIAEVVADPAIMPFEFGTMGFSPAPWTPQDVLAWTATMLRNFDPEATKLGQLDNAELLQQLTTAYGQATGFAMFDDLRWGNDPDALTYIADGATGASTGRSTLAVPSAQALDPALPDVGIAADRIRQMRKNAEESLKAINVEIKMGSYAWVLDGTKTASGNPIIYSGPQMGFSTPAITMEGAIFAGGLNISGMTVPGIPGIIIGRTPHHAWSMQVGHAHTLDYYFEDPASVTFDRMETINIAGEDPVSIPVYKSSHGPIVNPIPYMPGSYDPATEGPIVAWRYSHVGREFASIQAILDLAKAQNMDAFGAALENVAVSQHFCYADSAGNIAHWMAGYDPERPAGEYRLPQGAVAAPLEWHATRKPLATVRNPARGYVTGWNNKASAGYESSFNNLGYFFGPFHRGHVLEDYLSTHGNLTFDDVRNLAINIATTDSFGGGGNPWQFVTTEFEAAVTNALDAGDHPERQVALDLLAGWDGHFVADGPSQWAFGNDRADAWVLMDAWIKEVLRLTFEDELGPETYGEQRAHMLFNTLLHALPNTTDLTTTYNWFTNTVEAQAPQTPDDIVVAALDTVLADLGPMPWGTGQRGQIEFRHEVIAGVYDQAPFPQLDPVVHTMPFSSRSTFAHVVEYGAGGPVRIESMYALGQSGDIRIGAELVPGMVYAPVYDPNFTSMTGVYDGFGHRPFPLNP